MVSQFSWAIFLACSGNFSREIFPSEGNRAERDRGFPCTLRRARIATHPLATGRYSSMGVEPSGPQGGPGCAKTHRDMGRADTISETTSLRPLRAQ
jgi:hypothetical protein